jgi:hypothetical protein
MGSFFAWLWALLVRTVFGGPAMATFGNRWDVTQGATYRLRLIVSGPRARFTDLGWRAQIGDELAAAGFAGVRIFLDPGELPADWIGSGAGRAHAPAFDAWAEVTWPAPSTTLAPAFDLFLLAKADDKSAPATKATSAKTTEAAMVDKAITRPDVNLTADHSWGFYEGLRDIAKRRGWPKGAIGMLMVMQSEAGMRATAHNPNGDASGLIQFMPSTLRDLGWQGTPEDFRTLSAEQQLPWVEKYFASRPNMPANPDATAFYVATFLPAFLPHAGEPDFVLASAPGIIYSANIVFDDEHEGVIRVAGLTRAIIRNAQGARYKEAVARLAYVEGGGSTLNIAKVIGIGVGIGALATAAYFAAEAALSRA